MRRRPFTERFWLCCTFSKVNSIMLNPFEIKRNFDHLWVHLRVCNIVTGGGSGIRTRDTVSRIHTFQACAFNHSATPPSWCARRTGEFFVLPSTCCPADRALVRSLQRQQGAACVAPERARTIVIQGSMTRAFVVNPAIYSRRGGLMKLSGMMEPDVERAQDGEVA